MDRRRYPRPRGARGPQLTDETFEGRSEEIGNPKPGPFAAIAVAEGPGFPSTELWCFLANGSNEFQQIDPSSTDESVLYLDVVAAAESFSPPAGHDFDSPQSLTLLRTYARDRLLTQWNVLTTTSDWKVGVLRPFATGTIGVGRKIADGLFAVRQLNRPTSSTSTAWVWVFEGGQREIWAMFRPNELGGFQIPGESPNAGGVPHDHAALAFEPRVAQLPDPDLDYGAAILAFVNFILADAPNPGVTSASQLEIHDFRVQNEF